jgi:hypothetical protein
MADRPTGESGLLQDLIGRTVVIDLSSTYLCLGKLVAADAGFLELMDADLHDLRDTQTTREVYTHDSRRLGIRCNRARVLIARSEVVAIGPFDAILE